MIGRAYGSSHIESASLSGLLLLAFRIAESTTTVPLILTKYDATQGSVDLGEVWALAKDGQGLRVAVRTHPEGWQLCLCRDGQVMCKDICRRKDRVRFLAARWQANAVKAGWTLVRSELLEVISDERPPRRPSRTPRPD